MSGFALLIRRTRSFDYDQRWCMVQGIEMNSFVRLIENLNNWVARISAVMLGLMTLLILIEIFLWNTVQKTTLIADEYCAYGLAAIIFLGAGYCLKERGHIRITLVLGFLPQKLSRIITFVATGVTTIFMGYLWWYLLKMVQAAVRYNSTSGTLTNTPLWIPQTVMLIGAACFFLQLLATTLKTYQAIETGEEVV
jgi:TRAP-type C4-dicarboxylate transport system permease small subunit